MGQYFQGLEKEIICTYIYTVFFKINVSSASCIEYAISYVMLVSTSSWQLKN